MLRSSFIAASAVILCCATATGQQQLSAYKMLGPVKDAGIYHVGTGTWTRGSGAKANLGPDIIFRSDVSPVISVLAGKVTRASTKGFFPEPVTRTRLAMLVPRTRILSMVRSLVTALSRLRGPTGTSRSTTAMCPATFRLHRVTA